MFWINLINMFLITHEFASVANTISLKSKQSVRVLTSGVADTGRKNFCWYSENWIVGLIIYKQCMSSSVFWEKIQMPILTHNDKSKAWNLCDLVCAASS